MNKTIQSAFLSLLVGAALSAQTGGVEILTAYYGNGVFADVTSRVKSMVQSDTLNVQVGPAQLGADPAPNLIKVLRVQFLANGQFQQGEWKDGDYARLNRNGILRGAAGNRGGRGETTRGNGGRDPYFGQALTISRAVYGAGNRVNDVTAALQSRVQNNRLDVQATNAEMGGDPAVAAAKELVVAYVWQGQNQEVRVRENEWLRLPDAAGTATSSTTAITKSPAYAAGLRIVSAQYGLGNRVADVTGVLSARVSGDRLSLKADNETLGADPARGADKQLNVVYEWQGQRYTATVNEGQTLSIPTNAALTAAASTPADGVCFYTAVNYQGTATCASVGQSQASMGGRYGSVRFFGRARQLELFESANYGGRTAQVTGDAADLSQIGGGFFTNAGWASTPGSVRVN